MTLEEVIVSETAAIAPAHPLVMPTNAADECIVYQLISAPELHMATYVLPRVQLACWARSYGAAVALAAEVRNLFYERHVTVSGLHYRSEVIQRLDGNPDLDSGRYCRIVDVRFVYADPTS